jgi:hypothetical protein
MLDYENITARDLRRIVNREEATPAAIGLFVAYDTWGRTEDHKGIVTNELLRWIEDKWRFKAFANELDYWISLGQALARLSMQIEYARLQCGLINLALFTEVFSLEGYLYATAFSSAYEHAAEQSIKLKFGALSATKAKMLATRAAETSKLRATPKKQLREIERQIQSSTGYTLALRNVLQDAAVLLDMPSLPRPAIESVAVNAKAIERHRAYIAELSSLAPQWARQLSAITDLESIGPDSAIENDLEATLSLYLTRSWREWARAGVNLRALADSSGGIVELIRQAEIAAAEIKHER